MGYYETTNNIFFKLSTEIIASTKEENEHYFNRNNSFSI